MNEQQKKAYRGWEKFLKPAVLRSNLIACSLFIATYETLRASIIDRIEGFFTYGFDENGLLVSPDYQAKVLSLDKSPFRASQLWLTEMEAINDADMTVIKQIHDHRNALAHDILQFLTTADVEINVNLMAEMYRLVSKIDRWWVQQVEIPTDPDYDGQEVADEEITSGHMISIQIMLRIITGEDSTELWETYRKAAGSPD